MGRFRDPRVKPPFGTELDPTHDHNRDLVAAFLLNEEWEGGDDGSNTTTGWTLDYSKYRNHCQLESAGIRPNVGGTPYGVGKHYSASGMRIITPAVTHYDISDQPFTMEALVCPVQFTNTLGVGSVLAYFGGGFGAVSGTSDANGYMLGVAPTGGTGGRVFARVGTVADNLPPLNMVVDGRTWTHIAMTWDGATIRRYINGTVLAFTAAKASFTTTSGQSLVIGNIQHGTLTRASYQGRIAHARLWIGRALDEHTLREMAEDPYQAWEQSIFYLLVPNLSPPRTAQELEMRANIRALADQDIQLRANIRGVLSQAIQMRARVLQVPPFILMRANIAEPETLADEIIDAWEVSDTFGEFSRQFSLTATEVSTFVPGNEVAITAGYDENRLPIIDGLIDSVSVNLTPDSRRVSVSGRDTGAREIASIRITKTWHSIPEKTMPTAHQVIREAAAQAGLGIGTIEFPNYRLYQPYVAIGRTVLEIVAELAEPFNQFARVQYVTEIRDRFLSVRKIDYVNVPTNGYQLTREEHASQSRTQTLYLDEPRLNEVEFVVIRGASWTTPKLDLGTTVKIEYFKSEATVEVQNSIGGVVQAPDDLTVITTNTAITKTVVTETTIISECYGDKVLNRTEEIVVDDELVSRTLERYWYFEPGDTVLLVPADVDTFLIQSASPSSAALLWQVHTKRSGLVDRDGATVFAEVFRQVNQYYYNDDHEVCLEVNTTQEFDEDLGTWGIVNHSTRTHSQVTGGNVRTTLLNFTFEDSRFKIASADTQNVGGTRPKPNAPASKQDLITHQAQAPQGEVDDEGEPIDIGEGRYIWSFEHPYIGQSVCDDLYQEALNERTFQQDGYRWEELTFEGILNPNLRAGQPVSIEVAEGQFESYWLVNVSHRFTWNLATSSGTAKRLTLEELA